MKITVSSSDGDTHSLELWVLDDSQQFSMNPDLSWSKYRSEWHVAPTFYESWDDLYTFPFAEEDA